MKIDQSVFNLTDKFFFTLERLGICNGFEILAAWYEKNMDNDI